MNFQEIFLLSIDALRERKVRSALTILMVVVGSSLMVAINGLGAGFNDFFTRQFDNLAPNVLFVTSAPQSQSEFGNGPPPAAKITLNAPVVSKIKSLPYVDDVVAAYQGQVTIESQGKITNTQAFSMDTAKMQIVTPTVKYVEGSVIRANDPSAIILSDAVANPPGEETPFAVIGQTVRLKYSFVDPDTGEQEEESRSFVVRAIMERTGNPTVDGAVSFNLDAGNALLHKSGKFDALLVAAESAEFVGAVEQGIKDIYGNDIGITTPAAILETIQTSIGGFNTFMIGIALVALIVGAVGIITTLYTSVTERVREIGTMKAIGAQNGYILMLFLTEALMIGILGSTLGLLFGIGGGYVLTGMFAGQGGGIEMSPVFRGDQMGQVWILSVILAVIAGMYPAWKASRLPPIVALRRE